ncbi:hypothetical protein [Nocardiopsis sp. CNR-923]|uniref:hypothetical protein n=1 Tax=Nocardiopsis sp. CNR-923 TaxID=1904965 RepID=UPI002915CEDC|nr:hypothetical protein [Nocardiopsis sp. CNR-923]
MTDELAPVLAAFHAQSHAKDVAQVETLFSGPALALGPTGGAGGQAPALPALEPLRGLDSGGPPLGGPWTPVQRMLAASVEAVRVRRVSAADRYPVHRAYPSPRGLFGADLYVVPAGGGPGSGCLRVDPQSHALQPTPGARVPADLETGLAGARLVVAVDQRRLPPEYGRLRPSLALLEGGHLAATLGLTLARAGLRPRTRLAPVAAPLPDGPTACAVITLDPDGDEGGPAVPPESTARVADATAPAGRRLRDWLDDRTSGLSTANLVTSGHVSPERGARVTDALTAALGAVRPLSPAPGALRLYRMALAHDRLDDRTARELEPDGSWRPTAPGTTAPRRGPARTVPRTGATSFSSSLGFTLAVDFAPWARRHGHHAQTVLHTLLGWIAQWGCLGAAATGLCARPMRNYEEADWAAVLGLEPDQTPAYQLWVRAERGSYMDVPVDAAAPAPGHGGSTP